MLTNENNIKYTRLCVRHGQFHSQGLRVVQSEMVPPNLENKWLFANTEESLPSFIYAQVEKCENNNNKKMLNKLHKTFDKSIPEF